MAVVIGVCGHEHKKGIGSLAIRSIVYFEIMSMIAIAIGFLVTFWLAPGAGFNTNNGQQADLSKYLHPGSQTSGFMDFFIGVVPDSILGALAGHNLLAVIVLAVLVSLAILRISRKALVMEWMQASNEILFRLIEMVTLISPLAAFGAMASSIGRYGLSSLLPLLELVSCIALSILVFWVFLAMVSRFYGFSLWTLIKHIKEELLIAFSTSSSESVFPQLMRKLEQFGCSKAAVSFVLPTGYSFNLDGTAIYVVAGALFIQQAYGIEYQLMDYVVLLGVILITSKGAAGVSGAGFFTLAATLMALPEHVIPVAGLALLLGIDRFMSDLRAICNIIGNCAATVIISKSHGEFSAP